MRLSRRRIGILTAATLATAAAGAAAPAVAIAPNAPKIGIVCTPGTVNGNMHTFHLVTTTGHVDTPDGNSVFMWSYANADAPDSGRFQTPGPVLCVTEGEDVVVTLANALPEPSSIVFPGQDTAVTASPGAAGLLTTEAAAGGGSVTYSFRAGSPGTYLYQSGSDVAKQVEMGLYGALVVRPTAGALFAYNSSATAFAASHEYLLLLSEIDPELHHAVETGTTYDINALHNRYFAINGREFPDTVQDNGSALLPNQPYGSLVRLQPTNGGLAPSLVRMINVGLDNHPFHPHGNHTTLIAQDGRLLPPTEHFAETIGSGQTLDFLLRWDDVDRWNPSSAPLPEGQPNYRNLTFKDGNTWYGGSPYLGYKGTMPTGTVTQNVCGEWYFPWHSHALNEFTNFDEGFGGMGTLLRVDPPGGCFASPTGATVAGGVLRTGSYTSLVASDNTYLQVNPKTTTRPTATTAAATSITVASAAGFPTAATVANPYYVRIDNEVLAVTGGAGTTTWTVQRGQLGTVAATHAVSAVVTALTTSWYAAFSGLPAGAGNLKVTYEGESCAVSTGPTCTAPAGATPVQTIQICKWSVAGSAGCAAPGGAGWVTLNSQPVGASDVTATLSPPGSADQYVGTGSVKGQLRVLVTLTHYTAPSPTPVAGWGDLMKIVYDAP